MRGREPDADEMVRLVARYVRDPRVLEAMRGVPRDRFVPTELRSESFEDSALPIGHRQTISQPLIVGMMSEALGLSGSERILEIGTGSGYQAAILGHLAAEVVTVEVVDELRKQAEEVLAELGIANVRCIAAAEGLLGAPDLGPYDAILVTAAAPSVPAALVEQLSDRGRLVIPVGSRESQELLVLTKHGDRLERHSLGPCRFVPLVGPGGFETP